MSDDVASRIGGIGHQVRWLVDLYHSGNIRGAARELGIPHTTLFQIMNGDRQPRLDLVRKLASYYRVSADWLLMGQGEGPAETLTAGWLAWRDLLDTLALTPPALSGWTLLPAGGVTSLHNALTRSGAPSAEKNTLRKKLDHAYLTAMDDSCRTWHRYISELESVFGRDVLRRYMEHASVFAALGFSESAREMVREKNPALVQAFSDAAVPLRHVLDRSATAPMRESVEPGAKRTGRARKASRRGQS